jgi:hypothetical protein
MRFLLPVVASMLMLGFACAGDEEAEETKEDEATEDEAKDDAAKDEEDGSADAAPPRGPRGKADGPRGGKRGQTFDDAKIVCCSDDRVNKAFKEYLDWQQNLYKDQPSTGNANALWGHLTTAAKDESLTRPARQAAEKAAEEVAKVYNDDNKTMRGNFDAVSQSMHELVELYKGRGDHTAAYVFCPRGGSSHWYQSGATVQNPYDPSGELSGCGIFQ